MPPYVSRSAKDIENLLSEKSQSDKQAINSYINNYGINKNRYTIDNEFENEARAFETDKKDFEKEEEKYKSQEILQSQKARNLSGYIASLARNEKHYGISPFTYADKKDKEKYEKIYNDLKDRMTPEDKEGVENYHTNETYKKCFDLMNNPEEVYDGYDFKSTFWTCRNLCTSALGAGRSQWNENEEYFKNLPENLKKDILFVNENLDNATNFSKEGFKHSISDIKAANKIANEMEEFKQYQNTYVDGIKKPFDDRKKAFDDRKKAYEAYVEARDRGNTKEAKDSAIREYQNKQKEYKKLNIFKRIAAHFRNPETYEPAKRLKELNDFEAVFKKNKIDPNQKVEAAPIQENQNPIQGNQWASKEDAVITNLDLSNEMGNQMNSNQNYIDNTNTMENSMSMEIGNDK